MFDFDSVFDAKKHKIFEICSKNDRKISKSNSWLGLLIWLKEIYDTKKKDDKLSDIGIKTVKMFILFYILIKNGGRAGRKEGKSCLDTDYLILTAWSIQQAQNVIDILGNGHKVFRKFV